MQSMRFARIALLVLVRLLGLFLGFLGGILAMVIWRMAHEMLDVRMAIGKSGHQFLKDGF
jgi:hypothetical protein